MSSTKYDYAFLGDEKFAVAVTNYGLSVTQVQTLAYAAIDAKARAYCPYSNFRVGAALLTKASLPITVVGGAPDPAFTLPARPSFPTVAPADQQHGQIIVGANIENCSYPVGTCAERAALATAVSMGHVPTGTTLSVPTTLNETHSSVVDTEFNLTLEVRGQGVRALAVSADTDEPCSPCGMCRQFIRELLPADAPVFMFARRGNWAVLSVGELLPMSFGAADLRGGQIASAPAPVSNAG